MSTLKITKTALREEEGRLKQLLEYLPTLELKKSLLEVEVHDIIQAIKREEAILEQFKEELLSVVSIFSGVGYDVKTLVTVDQRQIVNENIAGIVVPHLESVTFKDAPYSLLSTPFFVEPILFLIRDYVREKEKIAVMNQKKDIIAKELRKVTIRVNLFKEILIPRKKENIKKIRIGLDEILLEEAIRSKFVKDHILEAS